MNEQSVITTDHDEIKIGILLDQLRGMDHANADEADVVIKILIEELNFARKLAKLKQPPWHRRLRKRLADFFDDDFSDFEHGGM